MTLTLFESIQRIVQDELRQRPHGGAGDRPGAAPARRRSDTDNYACTVRPARLRIVLSQVPVATVAHRRRQRSRRVGELVLVQFVGGDVNAPIIVGRLYNDEDRPPENEDGQAVLHLPLGAADDDAVHIELQSGDTRELVVKLGNGLEVDRAATTTPSSSSTWTARRSSTIDAGRRGRAGEPGQASS